MDLPAKRREMDADFRANEAGRAGDEEFHGGGGRWAVGQSQ
jgi:hypothetical protein